MAMKKLLIVSALLLVSSRAFAQSAYSPFSSNSTGGGGGGGGGSTNGTINVGTQFALGYYSGVSTTTISGTSVGTANFLLQSNGGASAPSWTQAPTILGTNITSIPAASINSGSLGAGVIVSSIAVGGINNSNQIIAGTIIGSNLANATITNTQVATGSFSHITGVGTLTALTVNGTASISSTTLNGVAYFWPGTQGGANTCLKDDGSGNLTWGACGSSAFGAATVLTIVSSSSGTVNLPASANGAWECYISLTQNTSNAAIELILNGDTTSGHYSWGQISTNDSSEAYYGPALASANDIPLTFNDSTVSILAGTDMFGNFSLVANGTDSGFNGEVNYIRTDSSGWYGTFHGRFVSVPTSITVQTSAGTLTGTITIIPG